MERLIGWHPNMAGWHTDSEGTRRHYRNGFFHREDGPASIHADGTLFWYRDGLLHREVGPSVIFADGQQGWYLNGRLTDMETVLDTPEKREAYLLEESLRRL